MDYQSYEDYMRSVLGYNHMPNDIYANMYNNVPNNYYDMPTYDTSYMNTEYLNDYYPETYRMIYPMICKICNQCGNSPISKEMLESMVDEIYRNFEPEDQEEEKLPTLKNGDVRNPNAKPQIRKETRQTNFLLRDLIKILLIRELLMRNRRPGMRPPRPWQGGRPPMGGMPYNF